VQHQPQSQPQFWVIIGNRNAYHGIIYDPLLSTRTNRDEAVGAQRALS
jgi:hypothetical protein